MLRPVGGGVRPAQGRMFGSSRCGLRTPPPPAILACISFHLRDWDRSRRARSGRSLTGAAGGRLRKWPTGDRCGSRGNRSRERPRTGTSPRGVGGYSAGRRRRGTSWAAASAQRSQRHRHDTTHFVRRLLRPRPDHGGAPPAPRCRLHATRPSRPRTRFARTGRTSLLTRLRAEAPRRPARRRSPELAVPDRRDEKRARPAPVRELRAEPDSAPRRKPRSRPYDSPMPVRRTPARRQAAPPPLPPSRPGSSPQLNTPRPRYLSALVGRCSYPAFGMPM